MLDPGFENKLRISMAGYSITHLFAYYFLRMLIDFVLEINNNALTMEI